LKDKVAANYWKYKGLTVTKDIIDTMIPRQWHLLVKQDKVKAVSAGGLLLAGVGRVTGSGHRFVGTGKVISVGADLKACKVGDKVFFGMYRGIQVFLCEEDVYIMFKEIDIPAIVPDDFVDAPI